MPSGTWCDFWGVLCRTLIRGCSDLDWKTQTPSDKPEGSVCHQNYNLRAINSKLKLKSRVLNEQTSVFTTRDCLISQRKKNSEVRLSCTFPRAGLHILKLLLNSEHICKSAAWRN